MGGTRLRVGNVSGDLYTQTKCWKSKNGNLYNILKNSNYKNRQNHCLCKAVLFKSTDSTFNSKCLNDVRLSNNYAF